MYFISIYFFVSGEQGIHWPDISEGKVSFRYAAFGSLDALTMTHEYCNEQQ